MKKLIVVVIALLLVAGAGVGGWFFFLQTDAVAAELDRSTEPRPDPVYVTFKPMLLPLIGSDQIDQLINITVALEVADQASADRVVSMTPKLNDAYIQALYGTLSRSDALTKGGVVDVSIIKRRLVEVSARVLGAGLVKDALIQMVIQRQL